MDTKKIRKFTPEFKAQVAMEAFKHGVTIQMLCEQYDLHPSQISKWKKELKEKGTLVFESPNRTKEEEEKALIANLQKQLEHLKAANEFLKRKVGE